MNNNQVSPNEEAVIELLTLTCKINEFGVKRYFNKEGQLHRIHGPALLDTTGNIYWIKNGKIHREDGPAVTWASGHEYYYIHDIQLNKTQFIQWQKKNGIKPIE